MNLQRTASSVYLFVSAQGTTAANADDRTWRFANNRVSHATDSAKRSLENASPDED